MGATFCVENRTNIPVAVSLEQLSIRYWVLIPPGKKALWHPEHYHVDRGFYTLRAIDASAHTFEKPNMQKEKAKTVRLSILMGVGGAAVVLGVPLILITGIGEALTQIGGVIAFAGGAGLTGASVLAAAMDNSCKSAVKRGVHVGSACKYAIEMSTAENDVRELKWEKDEFCEEDIDDPKTSILTSDVNNLNTAILTSERDDSITPAQMDDETDARAIEPDTKSFTCKSGSYRDVCGRYLQTLELPDEVLDTKYDKCFCDSCSASREDAYGDYFLSGDPPSEKCAVPRQCMKFGVKLPPASKPKDIFRKWHGCYHGTSPENIRGILDTERLLKPGDIDPQGSCRIPGEGRFTQSNAPQGHNVNQYFFTPSIKYTKFGNLYAKATRFKDSVTNKEYSARTIFQLRVRPDAYKKGVQTMGASEPIDDLFSNEELEWSTDREGVHYIFGILVEMKLI